MNGIANICTIEMCTNPHLAKGLCKMHYGRLRRTGTTDPRHLPTTSGRFWAKVNKTSTCWLWTAHRDSDYGHATFKLDGRNTQAYRYAWTELRGPIPDGLVLDHLCRVPWCVNPDHLQPVTSGENVLRGIGPAAINKRKTHCKRGHALPVERNIPNGRECKTCHVAMRRASRTRLAALRVTELVP